MASEVFDKLPVYDAPFTVWEGISSALDDQEQWQKQLERLPQYDAPTAVWQQLDRQLTTPTAKRVHLWPRFTAIAAAIALLLTATYIWRTDSYSETIAYSTEQVVIPTVAGSANFDDPIYGKVQALCQHANPKCSDPAFKSLKSELDELTTAKNELKDALGRYGSDPELTAQLEQIEQERTTLLHQLEQMI